VLDPVTLDPDAQLLADQLRAALPLPMHRLGVAALRASLNSSAQPPVQHLPLVEDVAIARPGGAVPVRIYRPALARRLPVLMYMHGGGWSIGTLDGVDDMCRAIAARADCAVVSVDYRLAPEHKFPAGLDDCTYVFRWLQEDAHDQPGLDNTRIAVGGDSAGANLALGVSMRAREASWTPPVFQLLAYPATDTSFERPSWTEFADGPLLTTEDAKWFYGLYVEDPSQLLDPLVAPLRASSLAGLPPTHVITAHADPGRDDAEALATRLRSEGVPTTSIRYTGVFHGFFPEWRVLAQSRKAVDEAARRLRQAMVEVAP